MKGQLGHKLMKQPLKMGIDSSFFQEIISRNMNFCYNNMTCTPRDQWRMKRGPQITFFGPVKVLVFQSCRFCPTHLLNTSGGSQHIKFNIIFYTYRIGMSRARESIQYHPRLM